MSSAFQRTGALGLLLCSLGCSPDGSSECSPTDLRCGKSITDGIKATIRRDELFSRYGGEEFTVVLPETDTPGAVQFAERLRGLIADTLFEYDGERFPVTISLGVATTATDSPARSCAPRRTAPYAVKTAHPRIAEASKGRSSGKGATPVTGITAYSASPPIEYIQTFEPSGRRRRVSSS